MYHFDTITLIRHAQSEHNERNIGLGADDCDRLFGGLLDSPLTQKGREQALILAKTLCKEDYDIFMSSNLIRSLETASIVLKNTHPFYVTPLLAERSFGEFGGKTERQLRNDPKYKKYFTDSLLKHHGAHWILKMPGGESLLDLDNRCERIFDSGELARYFENKRRPCFFTHGFFIRAVLLHLRVISFEDYFKYEIPNAVAIHLIRTGADWKLQKALPDSLKRRDGPWR